MSDRACIHHFVYRLRPVNGERNAGSWWYGKCKFCPAVQTLSKLEMVELLAKALCAVETLQRAGKAFDPRNPPGLRAARPLIAAGGSRV